MSTNQQIHPIQSAILVTLLFKMQARFSELNKLEVPSDQFNFHLKTLLSNDLIEKTDKGKYKLTNSGKEFANRFDTDSKSIERQAKISILICCLRKSKKTTQYLMQQRLKQPYYGYWGFITGKVRLGESILEMAARELVEETGLKAVFQLVGIKHKTDYSEKDELLEDKFFFVVKANNPVGLLKETFEGGKNRWLTKAQIRESKDLFPDVETTLKMANNRNITFSEAKFKVDRY